MPNEKYVSRFIVSNVFPSWLFLISKISYRPFLRNPLPDFDISSTSSVSSRMNSLNCTAFMDTHWIAPAPRVFVAG